MNLLDRLLKKHLTLLEDFLFCFNELLLSIYPTGNTVINLDDKIHESLRKLGEDWGKFPSFPCLTVFDQLQVPPCNEPFNFPQ